MAWQVRISSTAKRQLKKLENHLQKELLDYLTKRIETDGEPQRFGSPLRGSLTGLWRYSISDYHIICEIRRDEIVVLVLRVGRRLEG